MHTHSNARLTPLGRERLLRRHIEEHLPLSALAAQAGISVRSAYKWLARYRARGAAALVDRRSVQCTQRRMLDPQQLQRAVDLRHERCTLRRVATVFAAPLSTVGRVLNSLGLGRLKNLQPAELVRRYQWARPGDMIHVDSKQLAYVEVLPDEKQATTVGFLLRAVAWFESQGISCRRILSDNGSAYRSKPWREACSALGLTPKRTRPYTPRTNGKAERFIKTLLAEWAYSMGFQSSIERNRWLPRYLAIYDGRRCHMALAGLTPHPAAPTVAPY